MSQETPIDPEFRRNLISNVLKLFVEPEVRRRQEEGSLPKPAGIKCAEIILSPKDDKPRVRLNEEVRARVKVRYKGGVQKQLGEPVFEDEIEAIEKVNLSPEDDPNSGHILFLAVGGSTLLHLDLRRNRALARQYIEHATRFLQSAELNLQHQNLEPSVDALFSAAELAAKALLLVTYDYSPSLSIKSSHAAISTRFNRFASLGNVLPEHKRAFNRLDGMRPSARYLKGRVSIEEADLAALIEDVRHMISRAEEATL